MRWRPEADRCDECGFDWRMRPADAVSLVAGSPPSIAGLWNDSVAARYRPAPEVWSPAGYLWHLVDVLRIGSERLLTASIDPSAGIPCWDENALAEVRRYERLSPRVGALVYERAVREWASTATNVSADASVEHPVFGTLTAADIMRRNAHEVQHHLLDIRKGLAAGAAGSAKGGAPET